MDEIDYSLSLDQKLLFLEAVQSYWPGIKEEHLTPGYSGIRPKLKGVKDFVIDSGNISNNSVPFILRFMHFEEQYIRFSYIIHEPLALQVSS